MIYAGRQDEEMIRIAIYDDSKQDREKLKRALRRFEQEEKQEFVIEEYDQAEPLFAQRSEDKQIDILFLDIYLDHTLGTDVAKSLRSKMDGYKGSIIFCTRSLDHALEGFRVRADGYLVKEYTYEEFRESISRLEHLFKQESQKISFVSERIDYNIPLYEVYLIEVDNKGSKVHTVDKTFFTWKKRKEFMEEIQKTDHPECFYEIGRQYLVNMDAIDAIREESLVLKNGYEIMIPKRHLMKIKQDITDYIWSSMRK